MVVNLPQVVGKVARELVQGESGRERGTGILDGKGLPEPIFSQVCESGLHALTSP